jgi:ketosteroid isomerase-like protein
VTNDDAQDDVAAVRGVLLDWYNAMTAHDADGLDAPLSPTFLLIEHDELVEREALLAGLASESNDGFTAELSDFRVVIRGDVAWSTHRNHETWTPAGGSMQALTFLKTVVLVRDGGRWLIDRYHATRLSPAVIVGQP